MGHEVECISYCGLQPKVFENQRSREVSEDKDHRVKQRVVQPDLYKFQSPACSPHHLSWVKRGDGNASWDCCKVLSAVVNIQKSLSFKNITIATKK